MKFSPAGGFELSPSPRRSGTTTVKSCAKRGATLRHITCVCGYPWSSNSAGPPPPVTRLIVAPVVSICRCSKPGKKSGIIAFIALALFKPTPVPGQCFYAADTVSEGDDRRGLTGRQTGTGGVIEKL